MNTVKDELMKFIKELIKENDFYNFKSYNFSINDTLNNVNVMQLTDCVIYYTDGKDNNESRKTIQFSDPNLLDKIKTVLLNYKW